MTNEPKITVVLADDHQVVRQGLRILLEAEDGLSVVGEASNGLEVPDLVAQLQPDVLVLDLMMPCMRGLEAAQEVRKRSPNTRIVVLSMYRSEAYMVEALRNGASGYVVKDSSSGELVRAIREATAGRRYISPQLTEIAPASPSDPKTEAGPDPYGGLTPREREVLHLTIEGLTSAQTAGRLGISPRTVEVHRANILHKLGLRGQADLVRYAYRWGILKVGAPHDEETPAPPGRASRHPARRSTPGDESGSPAG